MINIDIYQIPQESALGWVGYNASIKSKRINIDNYELIRNDVYPDDSKSDEEILKYIYDKYNKVTLKSDRMFPVAVSDVVAIKRNNNINCYFRDRYQWIQLYDFIK